MFQKLAESSGRKDFGLYDDNIEGKLGTDTFVKPVKTYCMQSMRIEVSGRANCCRPVVSSCGRRHP